MNTDRLLELADFVEGLKTTRDAFGGNRANRLGNSSGHWLRDFRSDRKPEVFRMDHWVSAFTDGSHSDSGGGECKTAVCLAGSAAWLFCISTDTGWEYGGIRYSAQTALGLSNLEASHLFVPIHTIPQSLFRYLTPADGARVLRLVAGGKRITEAWGEVWRDRESLSRGTVVIG